MLRGQHFTSASPRTTDTTQISSRKSHAADLEREGLSIYQESAFDDFSVEGANTDRGGNVAPPPRTHGTPSTI